MLWSWKLMTMGLTLFGLLALPRVYALDQNFIQVQNGHFVRDGRPYHMIGANLWYGMHLGNPDQPEARRRLQRELDRLAALGVSSVRVLASSEGPDSEPIRIRPALQSHAGVYSEPLLEGLDFLLFELRARKMNAILVMANFWEWSGGLGQYLVWSGFAEHIPYPPPLDGDFDRYQYFVAQFYADRPAQNLYQNHLRRIIERVNHISGQRYAEDPTIMAWELCSEPRAMDQPEAYARWIAESSQLVRALAPHQLITLGAEGDTPHPHFSNSDYFRDHDYPNIDFGTMHIWPENFGWYDPQAAAGSFDTAWQKTQRYIRLHIAKAKALGKPLVLEEFGLARDQRSFEASSSTVWRDRYYQLILDEVYRAAKGGMPLAGAYFWAWSGEARPAHPGRLWQEGEPWLADPPHEPQGWYGVYDTDASTQVILKDFADKLNALQNYESSRCSDRAPQSEFSCAQQKSWQKCREDWLVLEGFCLQTCGLCYEGVETNTSSARLSQ